MQIACKTDVGLLRDHNEDCCAIGENFAIVADGMGGHNKGEVASQVVTDALTECFSKAETISVELIKTAIKEANRAVYAESVSKPECSGMGTTVVAALWDDKKIVIGHIGDSRIYEVTKTGIKLLTKDHTLVQQLLDEGKINEEEALTYPDKHVITRAVGTDAEETPDVLELRRKKNQWIVLCSDGLSNYVNEKQIKECVNKYKDADKITEVLVEMANNGGGADNITAVAVEL
ncbi:MAG: Stp1/IreP family PP2C-type Ser/Thr phosphatase [Clostridia bacterium]|nr:Stp1/IreP family PP2C-type Ser/Thr phosphatase [Clostridia bacterium]